MSDNPIADSIIERIIVREGGTSDDPNDAGGLTRFGITLPFLSDYLGHPATPKELLALSREDAAMVYLSWMQRTRLVDLCTVRSGDTSIPERTRLVDCVVDWAVQRTSVMAVKLLQTCLGATGSDVDGIVGPLTIASLNASTDADVRRCYAKARIAHRVRKVKQDTSQLEFLSGWITRDLLFL